MGNKDDKRPIFLLRTAFQFFFFSSPSSHVCGEGSSAHTSMFTEVSGCWTRFDTDVANASGTIYLFI